MKLGVGFSDFLKTPQPKWCLNFPSMACRVLLRKLTFLGKLLQTEEHTISSSIFTSALITDPFNVSIIQQCKMLESLLGVHVLDDCLLHPESAPVIVKGERRAIIDSDMDSLNCLLCYEYISKIRCQRCNRNLLEPPMGPCPRQRHEWYYPTSTDHFSFV